MYINSGVHMRTYTLKGMHSLLLMKLPKFTAGYCTRAQTNSLANLISLPSSPGTNR